MANGYTPQQIVGAFKRDYPQLQKYSDAELYDSLIAKIPSLAEVSTTPEYGQQPAHLDLFGDIKFKAPPPVEEEREEAGFIDHFYKNLIEGVIPYLYTADLDEPSNVYEKVSGVAGSFIGIGVGLLPFGRMVGGVTFAAKSAPAAIKLLTKAGNVKKKADKLHVQASLAKTKKAHSKAKAISAQAKKLDNEYESLYSAAQAIDKAADVTTAVSTVGVLGRSKKWQNMMTEIATRSNPKIANMANSLVSNVGAMVAYGQAAETKILEGDFSTVEKRLNRATSDVMAGFAFSAAGMPRLWGAKNLKLIEPAALIAAGMYSDFGQSKMTMEDRVIHGLSFLVFHYGLMGLKRGAAKENMVDGMVSMFGMKEEAARDFVKQHGMERLVDRLNDLQNESKVFWQKKTGKADVDISDVVEVVARVDKPKEGKPHLILKNIITGKREIISSDSNKIDGAVKKLKNKYKRYKSTLGRQEIPPTSPSKENIAAAEEQKPIIKRIKSALGAKERSYDIIENKDGTFGVKLKYKPTASFQPFKYIDSIRKTEARFKTEAGARRWAEQNWVDKSVGDAKLQDALLYHEGIKTESSGSKEYISWESDLNKTKKDFESANIEGSDMRSFVRFFYPESNGALKNLSKGQLRTMRYSLADQSSRPQMTLDNIHTVRAPEIYNAMKDSPLIKYLLPVQTVLESAGGTAAKYANKMRQFVRTERAIKQLEDSFSRAIKKQSKKLGVSKRDLTKHMIAYIDSAKFGHLKSPKLDKNPKATKAIAELWTKFTDIHFAHMVSNNAKVRNAKKGGRKEDIFYIEDTNGNRIELAHPEDAVRIINEGLNKVETTKGRQVHNGELIKQGEIVKIRRKSLKHHYLSTYVPRYVTSTFSRLVSENRSIEQKLLDYIIKNDPDLRELRKEGASTEKLNKVATEKFLDIRHLNDKKGVYGQMWTRVADLPQVLYMRRASDGNMVMIDTEILAKDNGTLFKKGDKIIDSHGVERTIGRVVEVYESNFMKTVGIYNDRVSRYAAAYGIYGGDFAAGKKLGRDLARIEDESGRDMASLARDVVNMQMHGQKSGPGTKIMMDLSRFTASVGLSFPISGLKNFVLGHHQMVTAFGFGEVANAYKNIMWNPKIVKEAAYVKEKTGERLSSVQIIKNSMQHAKHLAEEIGASYTGTQDLFEGGRSSFSFIRAAGFVQKFGFMRPTEILNRLVASVIGDNALDVHLNNLLGIKNPLNKLTSKNKSRSVILDVLKVSETELNKMLKDSREAGHLVVKDEMRLHTRDMAHAVTQGVTDAPYVPLWLSKQYMKPLALFYRIGYRMTNNIWTSVVKPMTVHGNPMGMLKYSLGAVAAGEALFGAYYLMFGEERRNRFKDLPARFWSNFIRAEGLGLLSNAFDEFAGGGKGTPVYDVYTPAIWRTVTTTGTMVLNIMNDLGISNDDVRNFKIKDDIHTALKRTVALYGGSLRTWQNMSNDVNKRISESRRRQYQLLEAKFATERKSFNADANETMRTPYYRAMREVFWSDDNEAKARIYYASLSYITDRLQFENKELRMTRSAALKKARGILKGIVTKLRPIPSSWRKRVKGTSFSKHKIYMNNIEPELQLEEKELDKIYKSRLIEFNSSKMKFKNKYWWKR